jgi:Concanavalin A-like lectin/glucanases superfamily/Cadherin-like domain/Bacterial Ig domain
MVRLTARAGAALTATTARAAALLCAVLALSALPSGQAPADVVKPDVRITSPAEDATVSGTVTIAAEASDASGIAGVIFEVDGRAIGAEVVSAPWTIGWNTSASGSGSHILTAIARDAAGNAMRSAVVPIVVGGPAPPAFPPPTNHNPTPVGDGLISTGGLPVTFTGASLLANDTDPDGHALSITVVAASSAEGGTIAAIGGGSYTYTPAQGFTGMDRFIYSIADGFGGTATATVTVSVTAATAPPPEGLVLALAFDEDSGLTAIDGSGGGRDGAIQGALRVPGHSGNALQFDGVDDWVTVPGSDALGLTAALTLTAWVNPTVAPGGWNTIIMKERGVEDFAYALYANDGAPVPGGNAAPAAYINAGGSHTSTPGTAVLAAQTWTHLAATFDGATLRLYVNGILASSRARTGPVAGSTGALRIGGNSAWPGEFFAGLIDDVRIYDRALTADEIAADMGAAAPPPPPNSPPVAQADSLTTSAGMEVAFDASMLLANDSDADGDGLTVVSVAAAGAAGGVISGTGPWSYAPASGQTGADSFAYTIADGQGGTATGTVNVTIASNDPPPVSPAGLVLALAFDEATGTLAADSSGGARHGSIRGATFAAGRYGNALAFDGLDDWVTVPDSAALDLTDGMTLEAWVKPSALSGWESIVLKERGTEDLAYGLYAHDGAPLAGGVAAPAGTINTIAGHHAVRGASALPNGVWTHIATTYDGATQRFYVNGALVASRAHTGSMSTSNSPLRIGGNNAWSGEFFQGLIDEVRIYNRALSAAEVQADMNTPVR